VDNAIVAILLEHDVSYMPLDLAAQAKAPTTSAGTMPSAKARIRIQKLIEEFRPAPRLASLWLGPGLAGIRGRKRCAITPGEMSV